MSLSQMHSFNRPNKCPSITLEELFTFLESKQVLLVDVREEEEFSEGHIPGSKLHPMSRFSPSEIPVGLHECIVFSCRSGARSERATLIWLNEGYEIPAYNLVGGFLAYERWKEKREKNE